MHTVCVMKLLRVPFGATIFYIVPLIFDFTNIHSLYYEVVQWYSHEIDTLLTNGSKPTQRIKPWKKIMGHVKINGIKQSIDTH